MRIFQFANKDLYKTWLERQEVVDGYVECALVYLSVKQDIDPFYFKRQDVDEEKKLMVI